MTAPPRGGPDDRAVSDLIGFVVVFSLIVSTVAVVSVVGMDSLERTRDAEAVNNAERAFEVLANNMEDIHRRGAPSRATEISLADASVYLANETLIEVRDRNTSASDPTFLENRVFQVRPIVYDNGDTRLVYAAGAVFREQPRGGTVVESWSPTLNQERTLIPVVNTGSATKTGQQVQSSTVLVRAKANRRVVPVADAVGTYDDVWINVTSPRRDLWLRMLDGHPELDCSVAGPERVECQLGYTPERIHVVETRIAIELKQ